MFSKQTTSLWGEEGEGRKRLPERGDTERKVMIEKGRMCERNQVNSSYAKGWGILVKGGGEATG